MKKLIGILLIFVLMFSMTVTIFASEKEDIFYTEVTKELQHYYDDYKSFAKEYVDKEFVEKYVLKEGEQYDPSKITHDFSKLYKFTNYENEEFRELINSKDIRTAILNAPTKYYVFPCYYDGVLIDNYREIVMMSSNQYTGEIVFSHYGQGPRQPYCYTLITLRENVEKILQDKGLSEDYTLVYALDLCGLPFAIIEKEDEIFLTNLINEQVKEESGYYEILTDECFEYLNKPVITIKEMNEFLDITDKIFEEIHEYYERTRYDGASQVGTSDITDGEDINPKPFPWKYVGIGAGVVVLLGVLALVLVLVLKKKKAA